ncbi:LOW QUALITY PROTEIN: hypothetical protein PHMEG_00011559 [Phytophthora megakarya]|uniref:RxLR effector protein n=1 Tax=Phytophthora megakarya TaxID=4795 RepID=A0A225WDH0_9STRA|nr:LOW QUALITY PROTEIN: hypothetical protein PHMEG_00011559 [Phytophthora megakarya]
MGRVDVVLLGVLLTVTMVQSSPWWGDIGAVHGVRTTPLSLAQLSGQFGRRDTEYDLMKRFPWRSLQQNYAGDDNLHLRSSKLPPFDVMDADHDRRGSDAVAKKYLLDIANFHYDNLHNCIQAELAVLNSTNSTDMKTELCSYAHEFETWFVMQLDIARHDLQERRVYKLTEADKLHLEQLVACAHKKLGLWDETELSREQFYDVLLVVTEIVACA